MLPRADCVFNLPSLSDHVELHCRLHFPRRSADQKGNFISGFAILAHPYAPLGGCYDDPIVQSVGLTLLRQGVVLCTFNFRGAMGSPGSTSWTGKAELGDYVTVYTFMLHLVNAEGLSRHIGSENEHQYSPLLLLGGYSYGSMIASHLPDLAVVQSLNHPPQSDSSHAEVVQRAQEIAKAFLRHVEAQVSQESIGQRLRRETPQADSRHEVMVGGYDSQSASRRISKESGRGSMDMSVRHGIERVKRVTHRLSVRARGELEEAHSQARSDPSPTFPVRVRVAYLLVSPLMPPVAGFTTMFSKLSFERKGTYPASKNDKSVAENLSENPTLAIYGDKDVFTSARKLQKWAEELERMPQSRFMAQEIPGAGHFWHEPGAQEHLCEIVREWIHAVSMTSQGGQHEILDK